MPKTTSPKPVDKLTYEEAFSELETIINALEDEVSRNPLEESMTLFERGQALAQRCGELLEGAESKVRELSGEELIDFEGGE